ncbi:DUF418 domain-containing protein [Brachybacterium sp. FME24]|uniref:DUF418 domain-containing protein n=1 Tax=Brachybacterium sp. FME24 TaxID=2742605 RepID=UPI002714CA53|nr:DUF418 domain-containing protein [Brachybacterium sp. FME24]
MSDHRPPPSTLSPPASTRLLAPDLSRGVMLLLIAMAYAGVYVGASFGTDVSAQPMLDRAAAFATTLLLDNRSFPMFAILFGYGLAWSVSRRRERGVPDGDIRRRNRRRGLFLLLFGALHAFLVFPGEILTSYGLALLLIGGLLFAPVRTVRRAVVVFAGAYLVLVPLFAVVTAVGGEEFAPTDDAAGSVLPGYVTFVDWFTRLAGLPITPIFLALAYPLFLLVALGFLAGRARLLDDPAAHRSLLTAITVGGVTISVSGALPSGLIAVGAMSPDPVTEGLLNGLQILTGVVGGAGYAALFALVSVPLERRRGVLVDALAAIGKRSLTFYLLNSVLVALILHPDLLGLGTRFGPFGALITAALVWGAGLVVAAWMERTGRPGPLEQMMGRLVDGKQPAERS